MQPEEQDEISIKDKAIGSLAKRAARWKKIKGFNKSSSEKKLRRKLGAPVDSTVAIQLSPETVASDNKPWDESLRLMSELPASQNEINELPDTSMPHEPPQELDSFQAPSRSSTGSSLGEPLPRYEPRSSEITVTGNRHWDASAAADPQYDFCEVSQRPSSSHSSLVTTPTRGLFVRNDLESSFNYHRASNETEKDHSQFQDANSTVGEPMATNIPSEPAGPSHLHADGLQASESLQLILKALRSDPNALFGNPQSGHEIGIPVKRSNTTGTESLVKGILPEAAPSATHRRLSKPKRRKTISTSKRKKSVLKVTYPSIHNPIEQLNSSDDIESTGSSLLRKRTVPKRLPASAGVETIWASLLQTQAKILGPEHPLAYQAKSDLARSRANGHVNGFEDLVSLRKSKFVAIETLGHVHPLVAAFSEDLNTLEKMTGAKQEGNEQQLMMPRNGELAPHLAKGKEPSQNPVIAAEAGPSRISTDVASSPIMDPKKALPKITTTFHPTEPTAAPPHIQVDEPYAIGALWNTGRPPHNPGNNLLTLPRLAFGEIMKLAVNGMLWLQHNYGPEPRVKSGKVRVRWTCSCGEQLYDDFVENRAGAARELEAYLNRPRVHTPGNGSPSSPESPYANRSFGASSFGSPHSSQTSWSTHNFLGQGSMSTDETTKAPRTYAGMPLYPQYIHMPEPPWLLTCATEDRFTPKLAHLDMAKDRVRSDKDLAMSLRYHYFNVNKKWWRPLRLRGLTTIEFVQFELHQNRFCDIRRCPDMPQKGTADYDFVPSDLLPPVGSQYLLHLFKHPEDYDGELITYQRVPKRNGRLKMGVGYGINLVEGFLADRVWMLVTGVFAFGSLVFAITWACKTHSIQGAYAVAAWMVSLAVLAVGWLQAYLG